MVNEASAARFTLKALPGRFAVEAVADGLRRRHNPAGSDIDGGIGAKRVAGRIHGDEPGGGVGGGDVDDQSLVVEQLGGRSHLFPGSDGKMAPGMMVSRERQFVGERGAWR